MYIGSGIGVHEETYGAIIPNNYINKKQNIKIKIYNKKGPNIIIELTKEMIEEQIKNDNY